MAKRDVQVRLAATRDRRAIAVCDARVAGDLHRRELIDAAIAARHCWVVEQDGAVAGYAILTTNFFGRDFVELLFVAAEARRKGIGDALLAAIERARPQTDKLFTSTNESNAAMRALLESRAYRASGTILNLDPDDPELVFVKFLKA
ncbi:MAG: GNAT family N-acetyltransferase [Alphaproteobacteria bacterium]|nr:GNAT family N-acetyltransferase [Alphaproteobacteria bacterium]